MQYIEAKQLLTHKNSAYGWFGVDYNMNLYRGCCHGCIYCDSRSSCYQIDQFDVVRAKKDALHLLEKECYHKRKKGVVGIGAMSDSYNPFEKKECLTRGALKILDAYGFGLNIETKSSLVVRDIDILSKMAKKSSVLIKFSISCAEDDLCRQIEPYVSVTSERLQAMKQLHEAGIFTGVLLAPVLPFLTDSEENIVNIITLAAAHGASFVYPSFGVTLRENQRDWYYQKLDEKFPGMSNRYRSIYGTRYNCQANSLKRLQRVFEETCKKYGLLYRMNDIIRAYKGTSKKKPMQLRLF